MKPRKTGFPYPLSGRKYLYPPPLALLVLSLASTLTCVSLSGCAAYTTANIQSAGSRILSPSPTSVSFGNVSVGNNSSLAVTLSNNGNSNVTISGVNTAGAGYGASRVGADTTLAPGQTATLVVFAPTAAGSVSGSVSVASNAGNSPATISLSGSERLRFEVRAAENGLLRQNAGKYR
jgi:archaellum component FlaF (FlaF/FlaG flagellin family)